MKKIFIAGNGEKKGCEEAARKAARFLKGRAEVVGVDLNRTLILPEDSIDLVLSLGGDGSFLNIMSQVAQRDIPMMGINFGRLGFLTSALAKDLEKILENYLKGEVEENKRMLLEVQMPNTDSKPCLSLNDTVICSSDIGRVFSLNVSVSEELLFHMRGDGLIVSTPTGSTAHSLSAGGALIDPRMNALQLTPMGSQSLSSRPLVVDSKCQIEIELTRGIGGAQILSDGHHLGMIQDGEKIIVKKSRKNCKMIQPKDFKFFNRLRAKLGWNRIPT